jgi:hypothetical protein
VKEISVYDLNCDEIRDGYNFKDVPSLTRDNLQVCIDKINELVRAYNALAERLGVKEGQDGQIL